MAITAGVVVAAGSAAYANNRADARAEDAQDAQEKLADKQAQVRASQAARDRRKTISAARVERARIQNMAGAQGQSGSSAAIAGAGSASAQAAKNVYDINTNVSQSMVLETAQQGVANASSKRPGVGETIVSNLGASFGNQLVNKGAEKLFEF